MHDNLYHEFWIFYRFICKFWSGPFWIPDGLMVNPAGPMHSLGTGDKSSHNYLNGSLEFRIEGKLEHIYIDTLNTQTHTHKYNHIHLHTNTNEQTNTPTHKHEYTNTHKNKTQRHTLTIGNTHKQILIKPYKHTDTHKPKERCHHRP